MKRYLIIFSVVILMIIALIYVPPLTKSSFNPFQQKRYQSTTLEQLKTIKTAEFNSVGYTYKSLFPYDFIFGEPNWGLVLFKNKKYLTEEDKLNKEFYFQCKNIGIDLNKKDHFFIITTHVTAGLNMDEYIESAIITIDELGEKIILREPTSQILSIKIEDSLRDENFPEIEITPGQWQQLINLLLPKIENRVINRGLLDSADKRNRIFIEKLFLSIGWQSIEFK